MRVDEQHVQVFLNAIRKKTGTDLSGYRVSMLSRRISQRLSKLNLDIDQYLSVCRNDPDECRQLIDTIAVNVSSFFRNSIVFEIIAQTILPHLREEGRELRVWSAGCAAGEEAYSIAILILEARLQARIFATDIDRRILERAETAVYPRESIEGAKLRFADTYFSPAGDGFRLRSEVKNMVHFSIHDLLSEQTAAPADSIYGSFDIVLCRNVLIYFSGEHQDQVMRKLYDSLENGGYLILGDSEDLYRELRPLLRAVDVRNKIFQKQT